MEKLPFTFHTDFQDINKAAILPSLRLCGRNFSRPDAGAPKAN
jgi:hypothetical protein